MIQSSRFIPPRISTAEWTKADVQSMPIAEALAGSVGLRIICQFRTGLILSITVLLGNWNPLRWESPDEKGFVPVRVKKWTVEETTTLHASRSTSTQPARGASSQRWVFSSAGLCVSTVGAQFKYISNTTRWAILGFDDDYLIYTKTFYRPSAAGWAKLNSNGVKQDQFIFSKLSSILKRRDRWFGSDHLIGSQYVFRKPVFTAFGIIAERAHYSSIIHGDKWVKGSLGLRVFKHKFSDGKLFYIQSSV